jgi:hypothetical protein
MMTTLDSLSNSLASNHSNPFDKSVIMRTLVPLEKPTTMGF